MVFNNKKDQNHNKVLIWFLFTFESDCWYFGARRISLGSYHFWLAIATMLPIPLPVMATTHHSVPAAPEAAKQQPRQQKQPCSLPEGDDTYMKQGWQYAIP